MYLDNTDCTEEDPETCVFDTFSNVTVGDLDLDGLDEITLNGETQKKWGPDGKGISSSDIKVFKSSGINVFHNAYGVGGKNQTEAKINVLNYVGNLNGIIANRPDVFMRIDSVKDMQEVMKNGKTGVMIGVQNASHFIYSDDGRSERKASATNKCYNMLIL